MMVGVIKFSILLASNQSLKGKRRVVQSLCQKIRHHFEVAIAEVEHNDAKKIATIGISFVSNDAKVIQAVISKVLDYLQNYTGDFILQNFRQEILKGF